MTRKEILAFKKIILHLSRTGETGVMLPFKHTLIRQTIEHNRTMNCSVALLRGANRVSLLIGWTKAALPYIVSKLSNYKVTI